MRRKGTLLTALVLLCALALSACSSMLERDYTVTSDHVENPSAGSEDFYRVETYLGLVAALDSYIEEGMTAGTLRFPTTYTADLAVDLERARRQMLEERPLGCYALEDISWHTSRIISYYEVALAFSYKPDVDPATLSGIPTARDAAQLEARLAAAMGGLEEGATVLLQGVRDGADVVAEALEAVADHNALLHIGFPEVTVDLYPEGAPRAVAEFTFRYPQSTYSVQRLRERTREAAEAILKRAEPDSSPDRWLELLRERCALDETAGNTAADALLYRRADEEGMARAFAALFTADGRPCAVVRGEDGHWSTQLPDGSLISPAWPDGFPEEPPAQGDETLPEGGGEA